MAMDSDGYAGSLDTVEFSAATQHYGSTCTVDGPDSWKVVADASVPYGLRVTKGTAQGYGVRDTSDEDVIVTGAQVIVGTSRWDVVYARRDWRPRDPADTSDRTTFGIEPGGVQKSIPATLAGPSGAGVLADQPLAAVQWVADKLTPAQVIDLRVQHGDAGAVAADDLVRQFYTRVGTQLAIAKPKGSDGLQPDLYEWTRVLDGDGIPRWARSQGPFYRSGKQTTDRTWNGRGVMHAVTVPNAPAGVYRYEAHASVRQASGVPAAFFKSLEVNGNMIGDKVQDDLPTGLWLDRRIDLPNQHAGGTLQVAYIADTNFPTTVQVARVTVYYLGAHLLLE